MEDWCGLLCGPKHDLIYFSHTRTHTHDVLLPPLSQLRTYILPNEKTSLVISGISPKLIFARCRGILRSRVLLNLCDIKNVSPYILYQHTTAAGTLHELYPPFCQYALWYVYPIHLQRTVKGRNVSCEMEEFIQFNLCKFRGILRSPVLRVLCDLIKMLVIIKGDKIWQLLNSVSVLIFGCR